MLKLAHSEQEEESKVKVISVFHSPLPPLPRYNIIINLADHQLSNPIYWEPMRAHLIYCEPIRAQLIFRSLPDVRTKGIISSVSRAG